MLFIICFITKDFVILIINKLSYVIIIKKI